MAGRSWKELRGGMAFGLSITNTTSAELGGVRVVLNDEYRCGLEALMEYGGGFAGTVPHGRSTLRPNESMRFEVNHDTSNGRVMRNASQQPLPDDLKLASVTLEAGGSSGRFIRAVHSGGGSDPGSEPLATMPSAGTARGQAPSSPQVASLGPNVR